MERYNLKCVPPGPCLFTWPPYSISQSGNICHSSLCIQCQKSTFPKSEEGLFSRTRSSLPCNLPSGTLPKLSLSTLLSPRNTYLCLLARHPNLKPQISWTCLSNPIFRIPMLEECSVCPRMLNPQKRISSSV